MTVQVKMWGNNHFPMLTPIRQTEEEEEPVELVSSLDEEQFTEERNKAKQPPPHICTAAFLNNVAEAKDLNSLNLIEDINATTHDGFSAFMIAAFQGHLEMIKYLLVQPGVDRNLTDSLGNSALMLAVIKGHVKVVEILLRDVLVKRNLTNIYGRTPFGLAIKNDYVDLMVLLMNEDGIDLNMKCGPEGNALKLLQKSGNREMRIFLENHPKVILEDETSDLWNAARKGFTEKLKYLIYDRNVDVNSCDTNRNTILILASMYDRLETVEMIMAHPQVDINFKNQFGNTALTMSTFKECTNVVRALLTSSSLDPNLKNDEGGNTAVHLAVRQNSVSLLKELLTHERIDVNIRNEDDCTPYDLAVKKGRPLVTFILKHRGDTEREDDESDLLASCRRGYEGRVHFLLENSEVDINHTNRLGESALLLAARHNQEYLVSYLLTFPAIDVNIATTTGETPIMSACKMGNHKPLRHLLRSNLVNINLATKARQGKQNAMGFAVDSGSIKCVRMLFKYLQAKDVETPGILEAHLSHKNSDGRNPVNLAKYLKHEEIFEFLESRKQNKKRGTFWSRTVKRSKNNNDTNDSPVSDNQILVPEVSEIVENPSMLILSCSDSESGSSLLQNLLPKHGVDVVRYQDNPNDKLKEPLLTSVRLQSSKGLIVKMRKVFQENNSLLRSYSEDESEEEIKDKREEEVDLMELSMERLQDFDAIGVVFTPNIFNNAWFACLILAAYRYRKRIIPLSGFSERVDINMKKVEGISTFSTYYENMFEKVEMSTLSRLARFGVTKKHVELAIRKTLQETPRKFNQYAQPKIQYDQLDSIANLFRQTARRNAIVPSTHA